MSIPSFELSKRLFKQKKFRQLLLGLLFFAILLGVVIVPIERQQPGSKITTFFDGFYWAVTTITTVGYGDVVAVSMLGKIISIALQVLGAMMFGIVIAIIGSYVNRSQEEYYWNRIFERINILEQKIEDIKKRSEFLVKQDQEE